MGPEDKGQEVNTSNWKQVMMPLNESFRDEEGLAWIMGRQSGERSLSSGF